jgi:hypothetical protein
VEFMPILRPPRLFLDGKVMGRAVRMALEDNKMIFLSDKDVMYYVDEGTVAAKWNVPRGYIDIITNSTRV